MLVSTTIDRRPSKVWFIGAPEPRQLRLLTRKKQPYWWLKVVLWFAVVGVLIANSFVVVHDVILIVAASVFFISWIVDSFVRCRWYEARTDLKRDRRQVVLPTAPSFGALRPDLAATTEHYEGDIDRYFMRFRVIDSLWSKPGVTHDQYEEARQLMVEMAEPIVSALRYTQAYEDDAPHAARARQNEREAAEASARDFREAIVHARTYQSQ